MFNKSNRHVVLLLSVFYWASRLVNPECDLPKWKLFYYSQVDELFYTIGAFSSGLPAGSAYEAVVQNDYLPVNLFEIWTTRLSLSIFGNNYLGLRFPSMLMGYGILLLLFALLYKRFGTWTALLGSALLLLDVGFLLSNRVAEPSVFRLFGMLATIYYLAGMLNGAVKPIQFLSAGLIGCVAFLFFYPTNFFVTAATFLFLLILFIYRKKEQLVQYRYWTFYVVGSLIGLGVFLLIARYVMGNLERFSTISDFSGRVAVAGEKSLLRSLRGFASNIKALKEASFFYFNPYMLLLAIAAAGYFGYVVIGQLRKRAQLNLDHLVFIFLLLFLLQSVFVNDYPRKKLLMLLPFVIYCLAFCIAAIHQAYQHRLVNFAWMATLPVLLLSAYLQVKYVYSNPTYHYKQAMLSLRKYDGKIIAGNLSYAFRLYNNYTPMLNYYMYKYHQNQEYASILTNLKKDSSFVGSIFYGEAANLKEREDLKQLSFCANETVLPNNPNLPKLPLYLYVPCDTVNTSIANGIKGR